jgi:GTP-binding protein
MAGIVVAIDGPSGSGKSSTAKAIATRANWKYLDTGALYRAATWIALQENVDQGWEIIAAIKKHPISFKTDPKDPRIMAGDVDVTSEIRSNRITDQVSQLSQIPELRAHLVDMQKTIIEECDTGIVVEGRDIGTVVAPDANLKVFLYADLQARALRRATEMDASDATEKVAKSLDNRDLIDSTRKISPLRPAEDALELDSTEMGLKEVVEIIWEW